MNAWGHIQEAERLLRAVETTDAKRWYVDMTAAQVHATLAQALISAGDTSASITIGVTTRPHPGG